MLRRFVKISLDPGQVLQVTFNLQGPDFRYLIPTPLPDDGIVPVEVRIGIANQIASFTLEITPGTALRYPMTLNDNKPDDAIVEVRDYYVSTG